MGGLAASVLTGPVGTGNGLEQKCTACNGAGVFLGKLPPPETQGNGFYLRTEPRMYMSQRGKVYDISDVKTGEVIGILHNFLQLFKGPEKIVNTKWKI